MVFIFYLNCGAWFKFKGLGLPILQVHLQDVWQEEEGVPLHTKQWSEGRVGLKYQYTTLHFVAMFLFFFKLAVTNRTVLHFIGVFIVVINTFHVSCVICYHVCVFVFYDSFRE